MSKSSKGELDVFEKEDWVAELLPPSAAERLVRASAKARELPAASLARAKVLAKAIESVVREFPEYFRDDALPTSCLGSDSDGLHKAEDEDRCQ